MSTLKLRPYQGEAMAALRETWAGGTTRAAVVLPTGMGKTVIFAHLVAEVAQRGRRAIVLVHRDELAHQAVGKITAVAPDLSVGTVKARRREVDRDVLIGSVQTLARANRRAEIDPESIGLVIVDECHHAAADSYMSILEYLGCFSGTLTAGFTATLARNDSRGLGNVWQRVAYRRDVLFGIRAGYLADARGTAVEVNGLNLAEVARSRGDYQDGSLGDALMRAGAGQVIAQAYREHAADRQGVVFAPTVACAEAFAQELRDTGIATEVITGATPPEDRHLIYKRYRAGDVQVLTNCMVLTEGWDAPWASCAVIARPTESQPLYVQMVGRALRPWPGKQDALVLDIVGSAGRHKLATVADLSDTPISVQPGESLRGAIERIDAEPPEVGQAAGERGSRDVDLFHESKSVWLQTQAGTWFVPTRPGTFFLWPSTTGRFRVGFHPGSGRAQLLKDDLPIEYALAWAEQYAEEADPTVSNRKANWRNTRQPSAAQARTAAALGISLNGPDGTPLRRGELSDLISVHHATRLLDRRRRRA